ncbi:phytoene desaturase family protein [Pseudonocardia charpentierae]|uniref:Phytoene desaturase family protein n=1 Tax=Pseudonocardia charpentierae TaxID=3075545 RepID=A0ABU2N642_9PSEU|nr:phytoene desaturase family protein [Pseudonocardia sp. DSM 45834]MDT0349354.1 phytoene desaturase family protein [Pseudonocardia sp. DSM 45834]
MARIVVVGAGVGGLAAAARLAAQGHGVVLHERAATHGGKLGEYRRDGFTFDTGPSLLTMPQVFTDLFAATGGPAELELEPVDPVCGYRFADGTRLDLPFDPAAVPAALDGALGPGSGAAWQAFHDRSARLWDLVGEPVLHRPLRARDLARFSARLRDLRMVAPWLTLRRLGEQLLPDPRLRMWLDRYATYSGSDPRRAPSVLSVTPYVEQRFGSWWVRGGLRRLGDALLGRCHDLGVEVHLDSPVAEVTTAGRRVSGVRLADGRRVPADVVVCDADARIVYEQLLRRPTLRAAATRTLLRRAPASVAGFVLLLALDGGPGTGTGVARPAHRVWFPADYDAEFDALFRRPAPVADPTVYVHAPADPAMAPPGGEAWFVLVNAPVHDPDGGVDWDAPGLRDRYADRVLEVLARRGEDVRGRIRWREVRTPADLERDAAAPGGAIYGTASHGSWAALLRPANRSPVPGLFLVGGSAHPGGGLPIVALSAKIVADLVGPA